MRRWLFSLPFLFAVAPVVALYASNVGQAAPSDLALPTGAMLALTLFLLPLATRVFASGVRAAVALSIFWWVVFSYAHATAVVGRLSIAGHNPGDPRLQLPVTALALALGGVALRRARREPLALARLLGVVVLAMLAVSIVRIARVDAARQPFALASVLPAERLAAGRVTRTPDVFYIIFDRFGSSATLKNRYGHDSGPFLDQLRARGFFVADDSRANYLVTAQSLASSLNMAHLLPLSDVVGRRSRDWLPVFELLDDHRLGRFLVGQGYRYVHIGSVWEPTARNRLADANVPYATVPEFTTMLVTTTAFHPILYRLGVVNEPRTKYRRVREQLDTLAALPGRDRRPLFVFAHFLVPHGPYVFNRDGTFREPDVAHAHDEPTNFVEQVAWLEGRVVALVDSLLAAYPPSQPPVIVIQGDEGPYPARTQPHAFDWQAATDHELSEKMRILNAIYAPQCRDRLYAAMTPVNTFRLLLNCYFGTQLEPLPDRSYSYRDLGRLYDFFDVTERVDSVRD
jgi:hypothetical protein